MKIAMKVFLSLMLALSLAAAHADGPNKPAHDMTMHHRHVMINHSLEMAAEGSNLVLLG